MLGKGAAKALEPNDFENLARQLSCHPANLEAIAKVESRGFGWFKDGRIKILFEKHIFYRQLRGKKNKTKLNKAIRLGLARRRFISPSRGGYKDQRNSKARYKLLQMAMDIDPTAALKSISMGTYQIMGFNYEVCGFKSVHHMWQDFLVGEKAQLIAFANFLKNKQLVRAIREGDFALVEARYNGGGLKGRYARKMEQHANQLASGKWANWQESSLEITDHPLDHEQAQNAKPLAKSRTLKGSGVGFVGGCAICAQNIQQAVDQLQKGADHLSSGTIIGITIGIIILIGTAWALYSRWDDAGRPSPTEIFA